MEKLDSRTALMAFQIITDNGEKADEGYTLDGLTATSAIDGYTVHLSDGKVTAHVMFHQSIAIDAPDAKAERNFLKRLENLLNTYNK